MDRGLPPMPVGQASPGSNSAVPSPGRVARDGVASARGSQNAPSRSRSFKDSSATSSLSIVFSASWVRLTAPIGEGAFSRVYEGVYRNPETLEESIVAVKILKKNMLKRRSDCLRFIKEAKIMTKISHRHIAACYGIGKYEDDDPHHPGSLFIVQELIRGGNLLHKVYKQMLSPEKFVYSSSEALRWMRDVAGGMQYLHSVSEFKPMIIHRDLKLENIMLAVEVTAPNQHTSISAKLVDFGLHKVIDDRIKKVVKRVISEANLGGRLGRSGLLSRSGALLGQGDEAEVIEIDDELELALAEQRAMVLASSVRPGEGPAGVSPLGASTPPPPFRVQQPPLRVTSRLTIEQAQAPVRGGMLPEVSCDEEYALQEAARRRAAGMSPRTNPGGLHGLEEGEEGVSSASLAVDHTQPSDGQTADLQGSGGPTGGGTHAAAPGHAGVTADPNVGEVDLRPARSRLARAPQAVDNRGGGANGEGSTRVSPNGGGARGEGSAANPAVAKVRNPVRKQSSMQRLMAKMKEIKLRVMAGTTGKEANGAARAAAGDAPDASTPAEELAGASDAPPQSSPLAQSNRRTVSINLQPQVQVIADSQPPPPLPAEPVPLTPEQERRARNEQLLDRLVQAHSVAQGAGGPAATTDDIGLGTGEAPAARRARAPPRRAVTMINEIRYNLTEAVGSWAYMAPEVVLGQPYNEKVDVFSFGVILFEVLNRKLMLVDEIKTDPRKDAQAYAERVARGFRPAIPPSWPETLVELITACWAQDPHCRPNFTAVVDALAQIEAEGCVPRLDARYYTRANAFI